MSVLYILVIASMVLAVVFLGAFIWAVRSGQFDDTTTPAMRIISDNSNNHPHKDTNTQGTS